MVVGRLSATRIREINGRREAGGKKRGGSRRVDVRVVKAFCSSDCVARAIKSLWCVVKVNVGGVLGSDVVCRRVGVRTKVLCMMRVGVNGGIGCLCGGG